MVWCVVQMQFNTVFSKQYLHLIPAIGLRQISITITIKINRRQMDHKFIKVKNLFKNEYFAIYFKQNLSISLEKREITQNLM